MGNLSTSTPHTSGWPAYGFQRLGRPPRWVVPCLAAFCAIELIFVGYARTTSTLAHLRALQGISATSSAGEAAAACAEADAALAELAPVLLALNAGRGMPFPSARAWGQVPRLAEAAQLACRSVRVYARVAPWPVATLDQGAAVDVLTDVRAKRQLLDMANADLAEASSLLAAIDPATLTAEPRLERGARALSGLRAQQPDVADALALATPERAESLLGGRGAVAWVLAVQNGDELSQAYVLLDGGHVVAVDVGPSSAPAAVVLTTDRLGLSKLLVAVGDVQIAGLASRVGADQLADALQHSPPGTAAAIAQAVLLKITHKQLADDVPALSAVKQGAEQHHMWLRFADPALQALVARHDWAPP